MSILRDLILGPPANKATEKKSAPIYTSVDGTLSISADDLKDERAFQDQIKEFADSKV